MEHLIPTTESHVAYYVYNNYTDTEQFVFNYIIESFPEFMYHSKVDNVWQYNEPMLSMVAVLAKTIGASRELILNLETSKDIVGLYNKITTDILKDNNKQLLLPLALDLQYNIDNLSSDLKVLQDTLIEREPFVKNNLVNLRHRGSTSILKDILIQYANYNKNYNVNYDIQENLFQADIAINLPVLNQTHPLYKALMENKMAGVKLNFSELPILNLDNLTNDQVIRQLSKLTQPAGSPRPYANEKRNTPVLSYTTTNTSFNLTIAHTNPQQVRAKVIVGYNYPVKTYLNTSREYFTNIAPSSNGVIPVSITIPNITNPNAEQVFVNVSVTLYNESGTPHTSDAAVINFSLNNGIAPVSPNKPDLFKASGAEYCDVLRVEVTNRDARTLQFVAILDNTSTEINLGYLTGGETKIFDLDITAGNSYSVVVAAKTSTHSTYSDAKIMTTKPLGECIPQVTVAPTFDVPLTCHITQEGTMYVLRLYTLVKNNDAKQANIEINYNNGQFTPSDTVLPGETKSILVTSASSPSPAYIASLMPISYTIKATATATNKAPTDSATVTDILTQCAVA